MADDDSVSLLRQGDPYPSFGPELRRYRREQDAPSFDPYNELILKALKNNGYVPSSEEMSSNSLYNQAGIQPNLDDPREVAAARMRHAVAPSGGRQDSGMANTIGTLLVPGLGAAQQAMQGNYGEAGKQAVISSIPFGLGRLGKAAPYAMGAWASSNAMAPTATAEEKIENPYKWDETASQKRIKAAEKTGNPRTLREVTTQEGTQRGQTLKNAADWDNARLGKIQADNELEAYKKSVEPSARVLKPEVQEQIKNAKSTADASKIYNDAMNERINLSRTSYEKYGPEIEAAALSSAALGGGIGYRMASGRAKGLQRAQQAASDAFDLRYGNPAKGIAAPTNQGTISQADAQLLKARNNLQSASSMSQHPNWKASAGLVSLPEATGVLGPNLYDAMLSPYPEVKEKATNNLIPGYMPSSDPKAFLGRDWSALLNHGRAIAEGLTTHKVGSALASGRDYERLQNEAQSTLKSIKDQAEMAKRLKQRATPIPNATVPGPSAEPIPLAPATSPPATLVSGNTRIAPESWGNITGVQDYKGAVLRNLQRKMGLPETTQVSGVRRRKD